MRKNQFACWIICLAISNFLLLPVAFSQCASQTNIYKFSYAGKSYEIVKELKNWENAAQCAVERGGYLVQIDSAKEQIAVYNAILASGISNSYKAIDDGGGTSYIWIGATDKKTEGIWLWNGENGTGGDNFWNGQGAAGAGGGSVVGNKYVNWGGKIEGHINEPDNYNNQDAAAIALSGWPDGSTDLGSAGEWNDINISNAIYYIIEYKELISGVEERTASGNIRIQPNVSKGIFHLVFGNESQGLIQVAICNISGKTIQTLEFQNVAETQLDLTGRPAGIYFVKIGLNGNTVSEKILLE